MEFRTPIQPLNHRGLITHNRPVIMLGSCFSDNIGNRLRNALFDIVINPFGTLYNPASNASALNDNTRSMIYLNMMAVFIVSLITPDFRGLIQKRFYLI